MKSINIDSIEEALERHFIEYKLGNTDENHLIALVCNAMIINYHKNMKDPNCSNCNGCSGCDGLPNKE